MFCVCRLISSLEHPSPMVGSRIASYDQQTQYSCQTQYSSQTHTRYLSILVALMRLDNVWTTGLVNLWMTYSHHVTHIARPWKLVGCTTRRWYWKCHKETKSDLSHRFPSVPPHGTYRKQNRIVWGSSAFLLGIRRIASAAVILSFRSIGRTMNEALWRYSASNSVA